MKEKKFKYRNFICLILLFTLLGSYGYAILEAHNKEEKSSNNVIYLMEKPVVIDESYFVKNVPEYAGVSSIEINNNIPFFTSTDITTDIFEIYSELDGLGRCQVAYANVCKSTMPTKERGEIGHIKPSGWNQAKYEGVVNSEPPYLYNRCHLIAFCIAGENDNEKNLITGTRYMNIEGMLPYEEKVVRYIEQTENHVLYRVTPDFRDNELVARGVLIEAYSVEDQGKGISFNVYCYNVQPGVFIDYNNGTSELLK